MSSRYDFETIHDRLLGAYRAAINTAAEQAGMDAASPSAADEPFNPAARFASASSLAVLEAVARIMSEVAHDLLEDLRKDD